MKGLTASVPIWPRITVCWSSERATSCIAILPAAPGLFSTNTLWPRVLPSSAAVGGGTGEGEAGGLGGRGGGGGGGGGQQPAERGAKQRATGVKPFPAGDMQQGRGVGFKKRGGVFFCGVPGGWLGPAAG